jgi:hypothetical protein
LPRDDAGGTIGATLAGSTFGACTGGGFLASAAAGAGALAAPAADCFQLLHGQQRQFRRLMPGGRRRLVIDRLHDAPGQGAIGVYFERALGEVPGHPLIAPFQGDEGKPRYGDRVRRVQLDQLPVGLLGLVEQTARQALSACSNSSNINRPRCMGFTE